MIRWKYLGPRSVVVLLLLLGCIHGLPWLIRWTLIRAGQTATGARVDIGKVDASLFGGRVALHDLAVADPASPDRNLWEADSAILDLDVRQLLHRKLVVEEGRVDGIKIQSARQTSGKLDPTVNSLPHGTSADDSITTWLSQVASKLGGNFDIELETVTAAKELLKEWPQRIASLEEQAALLRGDSRRLAAAAEECVNDPLRQLAEIESILKDIENLQAEWKTLLREADSLRELLPDQRDRLLAAKRKDLERFEQLSKLAKFNTDSWSDYLLGQETAARSRQILTWITWAKDLLPASTMELLPERTRGRIVNFDSNANSPDFLIRTLALNGEIAIEQAPYQFTGIATNLTTQPKRHGKPAVLVAELKGNGAFRLAAVLDRTGSEQHDRFTLECSDFSQQEWRFGDKQGLAVTVAPGDLEVKAVVHRRGNVLDGRVVLRRCDVEIHPHFPESLARSACGQHLTEELRAIDNLELTLTCNGPTDNLKWTASSALSQQVADIARRVIHREVETQQARLKDKLDSIVDEQLGKQRELLAAGQEELSKSLNLGNEELVELKNRLARETGVLRYVEQADKISIDQALRKAKSFFR